MLSDGEVITSVGLCHHIADMKLVRAMNLLREGVAQAVIDEIPLIALIDEMRDN